MRLRLSVLSLLFTFTALAQHEDTAKKVYEQAHNSVFLVYVNDAQGNPQALGSAFLVAPGILITNAHVIEGGNPVLAVDPVRLPLKVVRVDKVNDLAVLSANADLTSKPLPLSNEKVSPGEQVFAIGNPKGLENTISQGIVSGLRKIGSKNLIQITSPISHGSSGGPILNSEGQVIAVAVAILEDGENLNFAIPVNYVQSILSEKDSSKAVMNVPENLERLQKLASKHNQDQYSGDANSEYQHDSLELASLVNHLRVKSDNPTELKEITCVAISQYDLRDEGIQSAQKLVEKLPSPDNHSLLAYAFYERASSESFRVLFSEKDSIEQKQAKAAQDHFLAEAKREANVAFRQAKGEGLLLSNFVMGSINEDQKNFAEAISFHSVVANSNLSTCDDDLRLQAYRSLISENSELNRPNDTEKWFRQYSAIYEPTPYEWNSEGDRRSSALDHKKAAEAYEKAASGSTGYAYDFCYATDEQYALSQDDDVLNDGRRCITASVGKVSKDDQKYFDDQLPVNYRLMATVLNKRGSYQQALEYIKESLRQKSDDPRTLDAEADIFENLERYSECVSAEQEAIRLSDGKYGWMHFRLGSCYFDLSDWSKAGASFRLAADADKSDPVSAYNTGLSLLRQGYKVDATEWFREALKRNPDDQLRQKLVQFLR